MDKPATDSIAFLLQLDIMGELLGSIGREQWQTLYVSREDGSSRFGVWCALLDGDAAERALDDEGWDLRIGEGRPGFIQTSCGGQEATTYHRFGESDGVRPLVLCRSFHGAFPQYCELAEEFRLYHNLAEDRPRGLLLAFDSSGREIDVAQLGATEVRAQTRYIHQFQAGSALHLAIYIDSVRWSRIPIDQVPEADRRHVERGSSSRWRRTVEACDLREDYVTLSRILGKVILKPPPRERAGVAPFDEDTGGPSVSFIVGVDSNGEAVEHTSDPEALGDYFGGKPGAANYLTPVYFRREVLGKYFAEPERYTVLDGSLECLGLWSCQIDNDLESHVVVFLGDLGRDLPYEERLHWRSFNIPPRSGISRTNFQRSFMAEPTDAQSPDLVFREEYECLVADWERQYGWPLFLPLSPGDAHLLNTLRIPVTNSQAELDEQVLCLTKLLIDYLNEKEIEARAGEISAEAKGIEKLRVFFVSTGFDEDEGVVRFLRDLQHLRSTGSGHRKGAGYGKAVAKFGVDSRRKSGIMVQLLQEAISAVRSIRGHYLRVP